MAATLSTMVPLGTKAPAFTLDGVKFYSDDADASSYKATVIIFMCNHCPFVIHVLDEIIAVARAYQKQQVRFIAINSNDIENYPDDAPDKMRILAKRLPFPYVFDATQEVASAYHAACTPDFFIYDNNNLLAYRGQLDDSRPGNNIKPDGSSVRAALDLLLQDKTVPADMQKPSIGCNIKWKP